MPNYYLLIFFFISFFIIILIVNVNASCVSKKIFSLSFQRDFFNLVKGQHGVRSCRSLLAICMLPRDSFVYNAQYCTFFFFFSTLTIIPTLNFNRRHFIYFVLDIFKFFCIFIQVPLFYFLSFFFLSFAYQLLVSVASFNSSTPEKCTEYKK